MLERGDVRQSTNSHAALSSATVGAATVKLAMLAVGRSRHLEVCVRKRTLGH